LVQRLASRIDVKNALQFGRPKNFNVLDP